MKRYGYKDSTLVTNKPIRPLFRYSGLFLAIVIITFAWLGINQKLILGENWISQTYDGDQWKVNEGTMKTNGAWDFETHVWKTMYIMDNFPHFQWNPNWYLGMPMFKYYPSIFYGIHASTILLTDLHPAKAALLLVVVGHLLATLLTFFLCYLVSRKIVISTICSFFLLGATFLSLRSYGWEPITVVFLFLFPLGLLLFLREPLRPFRLSMILVLGAAYLAHPLIWFSLLMFMGIYLLSIAIRKDSSTKGTHYLWQYGGLFLLSIMIGAVQFLPQLTYTQVTSGSHMGLKYLPFYQVPYNILPPAEFFLDAGNLKGPGPIIMIAAILCGFLTISSWRARKNFQRNVQSTSFARKKMLIPSRETNHKNSLFTHELLFGTVFVLLMMVLFYYLELYNIFPMNLLRSIQYHRIIPEFIITACMLVAALSNVIRNSRQKMFYYSLLVVFALSLIMTSFYTQTFWQTTNSLEEAPEFIKEDIAGRITFPYSDQSLAVRNSFTNQDQTYGYYEQGITNPYADEIFSVSSGFHDLNHTLLYLKAANVGRIYVNTEEGHLTGVLKEKIGNGLVFKQTNNSRYAYYEIPLDDPSSVEAVDLFQAKEIEKLQSACPRVLFQTEYCGSIGEEFVAKDPVERRYLSAYLALLEQSHPATAAITTVNPDHYQISVKNALPSTAIIVKMTYDKDFTASIEDQEITITPIGPHFMLLEPKREGDYSIDLKYHLNLPAKIGAMISMGTLIGLLIFYPFRRFLFQLLFKKKINFPRGEV